jgi:predicted nucleic acid-binding protein
VVLLELAKWYLKEVEARRRTELDMRKHLAFVETATEVVPLDAALARKAAETDFLMKKRIKGWPLADSIVYATARSRSAMLVSGDPHFRGLDDVVFLESG